MEKLYIKNIINILGKFKDLKRSGWLMNNITDPESDAEHSFGVALLAMMLAPESLDKKKCMELALIHDLAEIYVGDFTPFDDIIPEQKDKLEKDAAIKLSNEMKWESLYALVEEYNNKQSLEAKFVSLVDKLETVMTACYYDNNNRANRVLIDEFADYANRHAQKYDEQELFQIQEIIRNIKNYSS